MSLEIVDKIRELQRLPRGLHWFCPRQSVDDSGFYYNEDIQNNGGDGEDDSEREQRKMLADEAKERKQLVFDALPIFSFQDPKAAQFQQWVENALKAQLSSCDVCVREYHRGRKTIKERLQEDYEEEEVDKFMEILDKMNFNRITSGLDQARAGLEKEPPNRRGIKRLDKAGMYAIFEALNCEPFLADKDLLEDHFDAPFELVQTNKRLKLNNYVPAMTVFLFGRPYSTRRSNWATNLWQTIERNVTATEFEWSVQRPLLGAMKQVSLPGGDIALLPMFWQGVKVIVGRLDKDLITHSLRAMDVDVCRLALEHLYLDSPAIPNLLVSLSLLLEKSPSDFWDAMGTISPSTVVEQVFNGPLYQRVLQEARQKDEKTIQSLRELLSWTNPFINSIKPANKAPACRAVVKQLFGRFQALGYPSTAREQCFKAGLETLVQTLSSLNNVSSSADFPGHAAVSDALEVVAEHLEQLLETTRQRRGSNGHSDAAELAGKVVQLALAIDCRALAADRNMLQQGKPLLHGSSKPCSKVWKTVISNLRSGNVILAKCMLVGVRDLVGLEKFIATSGRELSQDMKQFNATFEDLLRSMGSMLEKISDYNPSDLKTFFASTETATALFATMFISDNDVQQSGIEVLRTVSLHSGRAEAVGYILETYFSVTLVSLSTSIRQIVKKRIYSPTVAMIKLCADVVEKLCNPGDGIIRSKDISTEEDVTATENVWTVMWQALTMIFEMTETWSTMGHEKTSMMDYCRDVMQFADRLFDQYSVFASALTGSDSDVQNGKSAVRRRLLEQPKASMNEMVKWIRLRDEFLFTTAVGLTSKLLIRMRDFDIHLDLEPVFYVENVVSDKVRTLLKPQQRAELQRALEIHTGATLAIRTLEPGAQKSQRQGSLKDWVKKAQDVVDLDQYKFNSRSETPASGEESGDVDKATTTLTPALEAYRAQQAARERQKATVGPATKRAALRKGINPAEFKRKREEEKAAKKARDLEAIRRARPGYGVDALTAEQGSGLLGIGVQGKDHSVKGEGMMVSSESEEDESDEDGLDADLFGTSKVAKKPSAAFKAHQEAKAKALKEAQKGPVKKQRQVRSMKDMRARLAPDLSPLHKKLLSWDFFHNGDFPPRSRREDYSAVPNVMATAMDYQNVFQNLLVLEAWQGFVKARDEGLSKAYEVKVVNRSNVDLLVEVSSTMDHADDKEVKLGEGDIVLLSKSNLPATAEQEPHCLARVYRTTRKKNFIEVLYRVDTGNPLINSLVPNATVYGAKLTSITPMEREYGALLGLQYYDLCEEIVTAKPSPLLNYGEKELNPITTNYQLNNAQAKAIKSALDNDAFTLIQGPPGSGKTKTIVAIVGALLTESLRDRSQANGHSRSVLNSAPKKLMVCAPSNAAVDELVMRFKKGVKTLDGEHKKISVVRIGRSDKVNASILDVTLEELVNAKLGTSNGNGSNSREETQKIMKEHQAVSEELRQARAKLDDCEAQGKVPNEVKERFDTLRRKKALLGQSIDRARDNENAASRAADLSRRRVQQSIFDEAHVICATLSGSGHEMFQNLNIEFETVIIDEAAQCVELSALIPLKYGCAKCVLVGDPKQLPPTVFSREAQRFQYEQSLFVRMQTNHPQDVHLLDTQYRMHPQISAFPSKTFYDSRLLDGPDMASLRDEPWHGNEMLGPYRFFDVQGQHSSAPTGKSLVNFAEIRVAMQIYERLTTDFPRVDFRAKIGIITPYKAQLSELRDQFTRKYGREVLDTIEFNTTDAFQGRESQIIIFSCVRASTAGGVGFLSDIRRMNVGLTRAKSSLWVLGNSESLERGEFWRKLIEDARVRGKYTGGDLGRLLARPTRLVEKEQRVEELCPVVETNGMAVASARDEMTIKKEGATQKPGNGAHIARSLKPQPFGQEDFNGANFSRAKIEFTDSEGDITMNDAPPSEPNIPMKRETNNAPPRPNGIKKEEGTANHRDASPAQVKREAQRTKERHPAPVRMTAPKKQVDASSSSTTYEDTTKNHNPSRGAPPVSASGEGTETGARTTAAPTNKNGSGVGHRPTPHPQGPPPRPPKRRAPVDPFIRRNKVKKP